ncbi:ABC transporter substrate-binding protein [Methanosarcina sp. Mfa9]|uniref:ABC transporter substrate-binding protein n=1 Tax=Methanosarcina sp. Mfa9 TaxID=3439063 RepID=UPI003F8392B9
MNTKIKVLFIALIFMASVVLSGCVDNSAEGEDGKSSYNIDSDIDSETDSNADLDTDIDEDSDIETITITDDMGREITVPFPCERTVFLVENAMNSMYAAGGADNIVGIGAVWQEEEKAPFFRAIDPNYDKKRLSEGNTQPTDEIMASVNPELIFLWTADWDESAIRAKEEILGVPVYGVSIDSLDDLQRQLDTFSKLTGKEEQGVEVLRVMNESMEKVTYVTCQLAPEEKPTVYWMWGDIYGTASPESTANELMEKAGGANVLNNQKESTENIEHPVLNLETLLELNPEVIYMWYNENLNPEDIIEGRTIDGVNFADWQEIEAVKSGRVYEISDPFVYDFHSPRLPLAMMHVAKDLHPDRFADLNLTEETDRFYVDVYGIHYPGLEPASET